MAEAYDLDISGLVCPETVVVVRRCLAEMDPGEQLLVTGMDRTTASSIQRSCQRHGFETATERTEGGPELRIHVPETAARTGE